MPLDFSSITISFFIQATEDGPRLLEDISNRLEFLVEEFQTEEIEGYFGNKITSAKVHLIGKEAEKLSVRIFAELSSESKKKLVAELERSLDEHDALFLRLDRQSLGFDKLSLSDEEPIRVKLKPKTRSGGRQSMLKQYRELILES